MVVGRSKAASRYALDSPSAIGRLTVAARSAARSKDISTGPVRPENLGAASTSSAAGVGNATTKLSRYRSPYNSAGAGLKLRFTPKKGPATAGGCARIRSRNLPPATCVSLHTYFFIASSGATQIPPVSLQPGEPAIVTSIPAARARRVVA